MENINKLITTLSELQKMDMILRYCAEDFLDTYEGKEAVTLKDIYGLNFWLMVTTKFYKKFGLRFSYICHDLGFKKTGIKRGDANLYIRIN